ncbi:hypothetical protein [Nitrobacter hamburgensis]|uniref:hypothetical protein n=1 Tax=Nitrobacter hamburgensis TaxID=912 RepID=UPI0000556BC0|nr:hypothetical protein [Nitrobacter hamburgensis]
MPVFPIPSCPRCSHRLQKRPTECRGQLIFINFKSTWQRSRRQQRFAIGPDYDTDNIGIASNQAQTGNVRETTGRDDLNSGNSRCGHEFGTSLPDADKKALLEYLKTL